MTQIARTADEIDAARWRARAAADKAEALDDYDDVADTVYEVLRWVLGDNDDDPTLEFADGYENDEDEVTS